MDYDSPWKEILDVYFSKFLALLFRKVYDEIDWDRGYDMLDEELQQIIPKGAGRLYVDKLVRVWLKDGTEEWILIHVEVQTGRETGFGKRVSDYNYRIEQKHQHEVVSLVVLADDEEGWRENKYIWKRLGYSRSFVFPIAKLLRYASPEGEAELEQNANPFARFILAHLKTRQTRNNPEDRFAWKLRIVQGLYDQKFPEEDVRKLFRFIDWLMELPPEMAPEFRNQIEIFQEGNKMPYITQTERLWLEEGRAEGKREEVLQNLRTILELKFGNDGLHLADELTQEKDLANLRSRFAAAVKAETVEQLRKLGTE